MKLEKDQTTAPAPKLSYLNVIQTAMKAVPEVKWALAVVGVISAAGLIVAGLQIRPVVAILGFPVMIVFMVVMLAFAYGARNFAKIGGAPTKVVIWFALLLFMATATSLLLATTTNVLWHLKDWLETRLLPNPTPVPTPVPIPPYHRSFNLKPAQFRVSAKTGTDPGNSGSYTYLYGFSRLGSDPSLRGKRVFISNIKLRIDIDLHAAFGSDLWVYLGSRPFPFSQAGGQMSSVYVPKIIADDEGPTEVKLKVVVLPATGADMPQGPSQLNVEYNFKDHTGRAYPSRLASVKESFSQPMNIDDALYAQVLVWQGQTNIDFDVSDVELNVTGDVLPEISSANPRYLLQR
jgi:hypothetical protein